MKIKTLLLIVIVSTVAFGQVEMDSSISDSLTVELPNDSTTSDSSMMDAHLKSTVDVKTDSTHIDSVTPPPPLFDFRSEPQHFLESLYHDSTSIIGSRYASFGDVFDWMSGGYYYNLGGSGQLAYGSLFGGAPGEMVLEYDGLNLTNPITGLADFNLIPTESMGHAGVVHSSDKPYGYMPMGSSFHVKSRTIADNPIRSQVGYRTGYYQYDDVDIRVGIKASQKFWLDFGGVIKSYGGLVANETHSGTKVNARTNRRLGSLWLLKYVVLFNLRDTEIPLPESLLDMVDFNDPKQKDRRTDHAIILQHKDNFFTTLQYTKTENTYRASDKSIFYEQNVAQTLRSTTEYRLPVRKMIWRNGFHAWASRVKSNYWGTRGDWQTDVYSSLSGPLAHKLFWDAGLKVEKNEEFSPQVLPEANLFLVVDSTAAITLWGNQVAYYPSVLARYSTGPFSMGDPDLRPARYRQIGLAGEKRFKKIFVSASVAWQQRQHQIATYYNRISVYYANIAKHSVLSFDTKIDYEFLPKWRLLFKGNAFTDFNDTPRVTQRPNFYVKTFLQYHLIAFQGDLNAKLRVGAFILGHRLAPVPFYADYSVATGTLKPAIYPYVHAVLRFGAADIFVAYENFIDADVQYVSGYKMPQLWLRYGFIWHFVD